MSQARCHLILSTIFFYNPSYTKKEKDMGVFKRFILPVISIIACVFMIFAAVYAHGITPYIAAKANGAFSFPVLFYLIIFTVIIVLGAIFRHPKNNK